MTDSGTVSVKVRYRPQSMVEGSARKRHLATAAIGSAPRSTVT
jgi:hypothetical protein